MPLRGESGFEEDGGLRAKLWVQVKGELIEGRLHFLKGLFLQTASQMPATKEMKGVHFISHNKPLERVAGLHPLAKLGLVDSDVTGVLNPTAGFW